MKNLQIESLFKELKKTQTSIKNTKEHNEIKKLEEYCEELKENIVELIDKCEIDYKHMTKTMLFQATGNALIYRICQKKELYTIVQQLHEIGVPRDVIVADKATLTQYLKQIEHPNPSKFEKYHEFIRMVESKEFSTKRRNFAKDFNWIMNQESLGSEIMELFNLDSSIFYKIIKNNEKDNFEYLVEKWHKLNSL